MNNSFDYKFINKLIKYGSIFLLSLLGIIVFYYVGILSIIKKIFNCIIPVLFAIFLSFIMEPIVCFFIRKKIKRQYSVLLSYFLLILVIFLIMLIILPSFITQLEILIKDLPNIIANIDLFIQEILNKFGINIHIIDIFENSIDEILPSVTKVVSNIFSFLTIVGIIFIGALYLSFDFIGFKEKIKKIIPQKYREDIYPFLNKFERFCYRYIYGILLDSLILWVLAGGGFYIIGLDYAIIFGFIVAIFDLIPYVGPIIGGAPAVIVAFTIDPKFAFIVLLIVLFAQFIESNITQPIILKSIISLHPIEGILGILILGTVFGFMGMIISPIIVTFIKLLIPYLKEIITKYNIKRNEYKQ